MLTACVEAIVTARVWVYVFEREGTRAGERGCQILEASHAPPPPPTSHHTSHLTHRTSHLTSHIMHTCSPAPLPRDTARPSSPCTAPRQSGTLPPAAEPPARKLATCSNQKSARPLLPVGRMRRPQIPHCNSNKAVGGMCHICTGRVTNTDRRR